MKLSSLSLIVFCLTIYACGSRQPVYQVSKTALAKIRFELYDINEEGLTGPPDGKTAVHYELCVPNTSEIMRQVQKIDPSLQLQPGSKGRIGCLRGREVLCMGNTHQENWKSKLYQLAELPYVKSIQQTFFE